MRDLTGQQFGQLVVVGLGTTIGRSRYWQCQCDCGKALSVRGNALTTGNTRSCGCGRRDAMAKVGAMHGTHRLSRTREYHSWKTAKYRCYNPSSNKFKYYGALGVKMRDRWLRSFETFLADMGSRPVGTSLDRYPDNCGNYEPGNCRWATAWQQRHNRRDSKRMAA